MCSNFWSKVFEQAAEHPELLNGVGIFPVSPDVNDMFCVVCLTSDIEMVEYGGRIEVLG